VGDGIKTLFGGTHGYWELLLLHVIISDAASECLYTVLVLEELAHSSL